MKIVRQESFSRSTRSINEDIATVCGLSCWVLDASSGLTGRKYTNGPSDGVWFVQHWDRFLRRTAADLDRPLAQIVAQGIAEVEQEYIKIVRTPAIDRVDVPSASIALLRFTERTYDYFLLGDCTLILGQGACPEIIADKRVSDLDKKTIAEITRLKRESDLSHAEAMKRVRPMLLEYRRQKNVPNGYWVLGMEADAIGQAQAGSKPLSDMGQCLLMTDGFAQGWDTFQLASTPESWLARVRERGLSATYDQLFEAAESDLSCIKFPRLKVLDDASAVLTEFSL